MSESHLEELKLRRLPVYHCTSFVSQPNIMQDAQTAQVTVPVIFMHSSSLCPHILL